VPSLPLERLRKRSDYLKVGKTGERYVTPAFVIQISRRADEGSYRYGLTASRKVGGAVERNRAKRRLRVLIKQFLDPIGHFGVDYVLIARTEILKRSFASMGQELEKALNKLHEKIQ
jgi:ribonuclease P protein component